MNREIQINEFLKYFAKIYIQNPNLEIYSDTIYSGLMNYGLTKEEIKNRSIKDNFDKWINNFRNDQNLNVYHSERQTRFLQFFSKKYASINCTKLYVSFPKDKIYNCVNKIFKFISDNNMESCSKVADRIRSDSVVLRLPSSEDAKKVINFINNDIELSGVCKEVNPFLIKEGKVGLAYDYLLSYNETLSMILENYFKDYRKNNMLNEVSLQSLREYTITFYNKFTNDKNIVESFLNSELAQRNLSRFDYEKIGLLINYNQVIELISKSLDMNTDIQDYFKLYEEMKSGKKEEILLENYDKVLNSKQEEKDSKSYPQELLNNYIFYAKQKYGADKVGYYLDNYAQEGFLRAITRDNNFRQMFLMYLPSSLVREITNNDVEKYIKKLLGIKEENSKKEITNLDNFELFFDACVATYKKYGTLQLESAIMLATMGSYSRFTNGQFGYRNELIKRNFKDKIPVYCKMIFENYGNDLDSTGNYIEDCIIGITNYVNEEKISRSSKSR